MTARDTRRFELSLEIDAPTEDVWRALTEADGLTRWFPLAARVEPGVGGSIFLSWGPECEGSAPITVWEPNRRLQWVEQFHPEKGADPVPVAIDFFLESTGGRTLLRLVHSGIGAEDSWNGYLDSISCGWKFELRGLRHYLQHHPGKPRRVVWARRTTDLPVGDIARRVIGEQGQILKGNLAGLGERDRYRLAFVGDDAGDLAGEVSVNGLPRSFAATVEQLNNAYLRFEVEKMAGAMEAWLWLSTYDLEPALFDDTQRRWEEALTHVLG